MFSCLTCTADFEPGALDSDPRPPAHLDQVLKPLVSPDRKWPFFARIKCFHFIELSYKHNGWPIGCFFFSLKGTTVRPSILPRIVFLHCDWRWIGLTHIIAKHDLTLPWATRILAKTFTVCICCTCCIISSLNYPDTELVRAPFVRGHLPGLLAVIGDGAFQVARIVSLKKIILRNHGQNYIIF